MSGRNDAARSLEPVDFKLKLARLIERARETEATRPIPEPCSRCGEQYPRRGRASGFCHACPLTLQEQLRSAGLPERDLGVGFQDVNETLRPLAETLQAYLEANPTEGLILGGPVGRGKTFLAKAACRWAIEHRWSVAWAHVPALLRDLRASYDTDMRRDGEVQSEESILRPLRAARLLVVNDLGAEERVSSWVRSQIETLIDERLEANRITLITTNITIEDIATSYGERLASRLGPRFFRLLELDGESLPDLRQERGGR